ncbi:MAG TPA: NAD(P)-dependent alcohol dehydrogenase [Candidatus Methylacidiphilales bacterium]
MKSWQLEKTGRQNLKLVDGPQPNPGPRQVLVRTQAVSLNFRDKAIIEGTYPMHVSYPLVLGSDVAGEVIAVGPGVTLVQPGDKVISIFKPKWLEGVPTTEEASDTLGGPLPGVLAEVVLLPETGVLKYPDYLTPAEASTLPIAAVTAWVALFTHGGLQPHETVLVQGSGGVSIAGLQLAVAHGARVIATSTSAHKIARLKELGAAEVIDVTKSPAWENDVRSLTDGKGVNHILEVVGGESVQHSIQALAWGGHIAVIGFMAGPEATINLPALMPTAIKIQGVGVGSRRDTADLLAFLAAHPIAPVIDSTYDFSAAPAAFDHLDRGPFGKVVVEVR